MMSSNIKPRSPSKDSPTEPFKRAVTGCLRAIARKPELDVAFAAERPGIVGRKARLPEPPRTLSGTDGSVTPSSLFAERALLGNSGLLCR